MSTGWRIGLPFAVAPCKGGEASSLLAIILFDVKKILPILLLLVLMMPTASGQNKRQLERDKARIEKEIERLTGELGKARKDSRNRTRQIKLINQRIDERNKLIDNINGQMNHLDRQITRTEDSLRVVRGQIDSMKAEYARIVRTLYGLRGNVNATSLLFDNTTYNLSYLKMKYFKEYSRYRKHQAAAIQRREQLFSSLDLDLQRQRNEKSSLLAQERKQRQALTREQQQHQRNLDKSQQSERKLQQQINKKEQQRRQLQQQIQQLVEAEVAKSAPKSSSKSGSKAAPSGGDAASSGFAQNKGRMPWPVHYKSVAREYGLHTRASGGQNRNLGIDLNCAPGANVRAVAAGTVARIFEAPDGTNVVMLKHGRYLTVYVGLGVVSVRVGANVSSGQSLGSVYKSDDPTSQFSFQLWYGTDPLNPRHWLN